jgi:hypothetical protein
VTAVGVAAVVRTQAAVARSRQILKTRRKYRPKEITMANDPSDVLGPEEGDADVLGPEEGDADVLGPEEGDTDVLGPEEGDADVLGPERGDTDVLGPGPS